MWSGFRNLSITFSLLFVLGCGSALEGIIAPDAEPSSNKDSSKSTQSDNNSSESGSSGESSESSSSSSSSSSSKQTQFFDSINGINPAKNFTLQVAIFNFLSTSVASLNNLQLVSFTADSAGAREVVGGAVEFVNGFTAVLKLTSALACGEFILETLKILICPEVQSTNVSNLAITYQPIRKLPTSHENTAQVVWSLDGATLLTTLEISDPAAASQTAVPIELETTEHYTGTRTSINESEIFQLGNNPETVDVSIFFDLETIYPQQLLRPIQSISLSSSIVAEDIQDGSVSSVADAKVITPNYILVNTGFSYLNTIGNLRIFRANDLLEAATIDEAEIVNLVGVPGNQLIYETARGTYDLRYLYILLSHDTLNDPSPIVPGEFTYYIVRYNMGIQPNGTVALSIDPAFGINGFWSFSHTDFKIPDAFSGGNTTIFHSIQDLVVDRGGEITIFSLAKDTFDEPLEALQYSILTRFEKTTGTFIGSEIVTINNIQTDVKITSPNPLINPTNTTQIPVLADIWENGVNFLVEGPWYYSLLENNSGIMIPDSTNALNSFEIFETNPLAQTLQSYEAHVLGSTLGVSPDRIPTMAIAAYAQDPYNADNRAASIAMVRLDTGQTTSSASIQLDIPNAVIKSFIHTGDYIILLYVIETWVDDDFGSTLTGVSFHLSNLAITLSEN
jgi:hypothetical protein